MLYQSLWCLPLPDNAALPLFQRLRDACRQATQQHPQLAVALLFSGSTTLLLAEGDPAAVTEVAQVLQSTGLQQAPQAALAQPPDSAQAPEASDGSGGSGGLDGPGGLAILDNPNSPNAPTAAAAAAAPAAGPRLRALAPGQCRVGYLDGDDCHALGPSDSPAADKVAAFWRLWRGADRG